MFYINFISIYFDKSLKQRIYTFGPHCIYISPAHRIVCFHFLVLLPPHSTQPFLFVYVRGEQNTECRSTGRMRVESFTV